MLQFLVEEETASERASAQPRPGRHMEKSGGLINQRPLVPCYLLQLGAEEKEEEEEAGDGEREKMWRGNRNI